MARQWKVITKRDVGKYWEGFGYVQAQDVGKLYYKDSGGYYVENNEQRAKRLERGGSSQKNPGAASIPRGKWVNAQVMVTSSGQIKAKIPASAMRRRNPQEDNGQYLIDLAYQAGRKWRQHGAATSGVANARVVRYGFLKWWNDNITTGPLPYTSIGSSRRLTKTKLEKVFREGYKLGKY